MNKVFLIGRLVRDPELRYTSSNIPVATFSLAVNRNFTGQNGERETDFINIVVWRKQAENCKNYINHVQFLDTKATREQRQENNNVNPYNFEEPKKEINTNNIPDDPFKDFGAEIKIEENDLPF